MADISVIKLPNGSEYSLKDSGAIQSSEKGVANGVAPLDSNSLINEIYLPSYVDDIILGYYYNSAFYTTSAHTTAITGLTGKIYIDLSENKSYRWSGSVFVEIASGGHTYTAGDGIDISAGDVISIDSNLTVSGETAYLSYTVPTEDLTKQDLLVSGTNIKTINSTSLLGAGNIVTEISLTQVQYDTLSAAEKANGVTYFITSSNEDEVAIYKHGKKYSSMEENFPSLVKYENTYTTTSTSTATIPIGITGYSNSDILFVDADGLNLTLGTDYTINGSNIILSTALTDGTDIHFTVLRLL